MQKVCRIQKSKFLYISGRILLLCTRYVTCGRRKTKFLKEKNAVDVTTSLGFLIQIMLIYKLH